MHHNQWKNYKWTVLSSVYSPCAINVRSCIVVEAFKHLIKWYVVLENILLAISWWFYYAWLQYMEMTICYQSITLFKRFYYYAAANVDCARWMNWRKHRSFDWLWCIMKIWNSFIIWNLLNLWTVVPALHRVLHHREELCRHTVHAVTKITDNCCHSQQWSP